MWNVYIVTFYMWDSPESDKTNVSLRKGLNAICVLNQDLPNVDRRQQKTPIKQTTHTKHQFENVSHNNRERNIRLYDMYTTFEVGKSIQYNLKVGTTNKQQTKHPTNQTNKTTTKQSK